MSVLNGRSVMVALDRERHLRYTWNALCRLQENAGRTLDDLLKEPRLGFVELRVILWAGLITEEPNLSVEATGEALQSYIEQGGTLDALFDRAVEALKLSGLYGTAQPEAGNAPLASPTS